MKTKNTGATSALALQLARRLPNQLVCCVGSPHCLTAAAAAGAKATAAGAEAAAGGADLAAQGASRGAARGERGARPLARGEFCALIVALLLALIVAVVTNSATVESSKIGRCL